VSVHEIQEVVDSARFLALGQLRLNVPDAIVLHVGHEKLVPYDDAIDVEHQGLDRHF